MTTPGTADSFLKALHISRTRHAHQVTAAVEYVLMEKAYYACREGVETEIPAVATELKTGNFVVNKTNSAFFSLPIDQAHEQNNKIVKGDRGAIGLTDSSTQLLRWIVSGPEISRIITDFELSQKIVRNTTKQEEQEHLLHHKQIEGVQNTFWKQVNAVCSTTQEMRKPFTDHTGDMFVLDTRDIADSKVVETIRIVEQLGKDQYQRFVTTRLQERTTPLFDTIQKNKLPLFSSPPATRENSSDRLKIASLKNNCSLFSRLYISCQVRNGDLEGFSGHENQSSHYLRMGSSGLVPNRICCHALRRMDQHKPKSHLLKLYY